MTSFFIFIINEYLEHPKMNKTCNLNELFIFAITVFLTSISICLFIQLELTSKYFLINNKKEKGLNFEHKIKPFYFYAIHIKTT